MYYLKILKNDSSVTQENKDLLLKYVFQSVIGRARILQEKDLRKYIKEKERFSSMKKLENERVDVIPLGNKSLTINMLNN